MCKGVSLHMAVGFDYPELADFFFFFSPAVIFSFTDCCQHLSARLCEAHFFSGSLDLTVQEEIEQKGIDQSVETVTAVSVDDGFSLQTLRLWGEIEF